MIKNFLSQTRGASIVEVGLLVALIAIILLSSISSVGSNLARLFGVTEQTLTNAKNGLPIANDGTGTGAEDPSDSNYHSCKDWVDAADSNFTDNGLNEIYPNGASTPINVYCQGAKTLILAQYESNAVTDWNEGIQSNYDPTLASLQSFALNNAEIPSHNKVYFGQNLGTPAYCLVAQYHTGDLPAWQDTTAITYPDCTTPTTRYFLARDSVIYYSAHNPDAAKGATPSSWSNTLTIELHETEAGLSTGANLNWAFSPGYNTERSRGYSYLGKSYSSVSNSEAWTVWVE